jgi:hypothetical protein
MLSLLEAEQQHHPTHIHSFFQSLRQPFILSFLQTPVHQLFNKRTSPQPTMFPKPLYSLTAALLAAPMVNGHYIFSQLLVNGAAVGGDYDYIRKNTNSYMPSFTSDVINSEDLRCNQGALSATAKTMEVKAGDQIGSKLSFNEFIEHPGPGMIYMSKAPGAVSEYKGDGDWFKVWESGPDNGPANVDTSWGTWQKDSMSFTIPKDIPDGEYLVRFEHVAIHENHVGKSQFYMECAQLSISGGGDGSPSPMVQIPGVYTAQDPAFTYSIWDGVDNGYTMPGPAVWSGGGSGGASSSSSAGSSSSGNTTESEAEVPASSGATTGSTTGSEAPVASGSASSGSTTGSQAPTFSAPASSGASTGQWNAPSSSTGGEMSASVPVAESSSAQNGGWGSWGTASNNGEKRDCDVEYVGGSAARARRAVRA